MAQVLTILGYFLPVAEIMQQDWPTLSLSVHRICSVQIAYCITSPPVPAAVLNAITFESKCFRVVSDGTYTNSAALYSGPETHGHAEAVVSFNDQGEYSIVYWSEETPETAAKPA